MVIGGDSIEKGKEKKPEGLLEPRRPCFRSEVRPDISWSKIKSHLYGPAKNMNEGSATCQRF